MLILFIGDIMGKPGRIALKEILPNLGPRKKYDFIIANCENSAGGMGVTSQVMKELFSMGVDILTGGNHIWDKREFIPVLREERKVIRPANYPEACPGYGWIVMKKGDARICVINLQGRVFMDPIDCPFACAEKLVEKLGAETRNILIDFHAEATSEKKALCRYLDGGVSAVIGTHTHVQTSDEMISANGTAFITDVGMTGGHGGVIGMSYESVIPRFLTGMPSKFEVCGSDLHLQAIELEIDDSSGRAISVRRIDEKLAEPAIKADTGGV